MADDSYRETESEFESHSGEVDQMTYWATDRGDRKESLKKEKPPVKPKGFLFFIAES